MSDAAIMARLAALEARVTELESRSGAPAASGGGSSDEIRQEQPIADHQLENSWARKTIDKDPKSYKGPTMVGKTWDRASIEWLEAAARSFEYKAHMGRIAVPVRVNNKGEPWHKSDSFTAKVLRGWIARKQKAPKPAPAPTGDDTDFNFGANAPVDEEIGF